MTRHAIYLKWFHAIRGSRTAPGLLLLLVFGFATTPATASQPYLPAGSNYTSIAAAPGGGFWVQLDSNDYPPRPKTLAIEGAPQYESVNEVGSITAIPGKNGYWVVTWEGEIHARGDAPNLCHGDLEKCSGFREFSRGILAADASPHGDGLWAVDNEGAVWTAGNVQSYGDVMGANGYPTDIAATPSGRGYYIVSTDGGVHARGDAVFYGSTGGNPPGGHDVTGIALSYDILGKVNGYWLIGSDGEVHPFGDALKLGSTGGAPGRGSVSNIVTRPDGRSYAWVYKDGKVEKSLDAPPFVITSITEGKVIDVPNSSTEPETWLKLAAANDSAGQKWKLLPHNGAFKIVNVNSGLCMDLENGAASGRVIQYPCKEELNPTNQLWKAVSDLNGGIQFHLLEHPEYRLYGYPEEMGGGLIVSYYTNPGLGWTVTPAP